MMKSMLVKAMTKHLLDIPIVFELSLVLKFMLLIRCPVLQIASKHVDNFLGRDSVVIEATGIITPLVSI